MKKNIRLVKVILLLCIVQSATAVNYYWVGGSGNWSDINHWATTSGGAIKHGVVPGPSDDLFFNSSSNLPLNTSFTVTVDVVANCHNMTWNGAPGTPLVKSVTTEPLNIYGSSVLQTGMNCSINTMSYLSSNVGETITSNGVQLNSTVKINGTGSFTFSDDFYDVGQFGLVLSKGLLNTNSKMVTINFLNYSYASGGPVNLPTTTTLTLGSSTITVTGQTNLQSWYYKGTGTTLNAGTSHIILTAGTPYGGFLDTESNHTYYNVTFSGIGGGSRLNGGTNTQFNNVVSTDYLEFNGGSMRANYLKIGGASIIRGNNTVIGCHLGGNSAINNNNIFDTLQFAPTKVYTMQSGATQTINKVWSAITPVCSGLMEIKSSTVNSQSTFSFVAGSTATVTNVMLTDMKAVGSLVPLSCTGFDMGNNTGFTITNPAALNLHWVGGTGSWNDPLHWSLTNGGAGGACIPTPIDNVFFDSGSNLPSNTSFTTTVSGASAYCHNMTWNGAPGTPVLNSATGFILNIYGSSVLQTGMNCSTEVLYSSTGAGETITSNGVHVTGKVSINAIATYSLTDNFYSTTEFYLLKGGLNTTSKAFSMNLFNYGPIVVNLPTTTTLTLGSSTVTVSGDLNAQNWNYVGTGTTLNAGTSHIYFTSTGPSGGNLNVQSNHIYYDVTYLFGGRVILGTNNQFHNVVSLGTLNYGWNFAVSSTTNFLNILGDAVINGNNTIIGCHLGLNASINGSNLFDTLFFSPTKVYTMGNGVTQTIKKVWSAITPNCFGLAEIKSSTIGSQSTFSFVAGCTATVTNVMFTDMKALGSLTPLPCTGFDMGNNTGFTITNPIAKNLYWIGGSGNWNDASHWALTSGASYPSASGCVPTPIDNVFFDALSNQPSNTSFTTTISGAAGYCHNMTWSGAPGVPQLKSATTESLNIYGSSVLQTGMNCSINTMSYLSSNVGETITSNGVQLNSTVKINGTGSFTFSDDFYAVGQFGLVLSKGLLNTNSKMVTINFLNYSFVSGGPVNLPTTTTLTLGSSTITVTGQTNAQSWFYKGSGTTLNAGTSHIIFTAGSPYGGKLEAENNHIYNNVTFSVGGSNTLIGGANTRFNNIISNGSLSYNGGVMQTKRMIVAGDVAITGTNTFTYCSIGGNGNINGANKMDTLVLSAGKTYVLQATQTQTVTSKLYASGNPCFLLILRSSVAGTRANLNVQGGSVNFDYGDIKDINASGLTLNYAGHTTDAGNNNNVTIAPAAGTGIVGLGPNATLNCNQYPYTLNTIQFYPNPNTSFLWSDASTTNSLVVANPGTYSVSVMYGNGCVVKDTIILSIQSPMPITMAASNSVICNGSATNINASGVSSYTWSTGGTSASISVSPTITTVYTVTGTDVNSCVNTQTLSISVNPTPTIAIASVNSGTICLGNNSVITPGGASSYTLMPGNIIGTSFTVSPVSIQTYTISGTSSVGCISTAATNTTVTVNVNTLPLLTVSSTTNVSCFGLANGSVSLTPNAGAGSGYTITPTVFTNLALGTYTYSVIDANACSNYTVVSITQPTAALSSVVSNTTNNTSCSFPNGSATVTASGGTPTYTVNWDNGSQGVGTNLNTGVHTYSVTDVNGCFNNNGSLSIPGVTGITANAASQNSVSCFGGSNGSLSYTTSGGTSYSYTLTSATTTLTNTTGLFSSLSAGNYSVYVVDNMSGCIDNDIITLASPSNSVSVASINTNTVLCYGGIGSASVTATGGTSPYAYNWSSNTSTISTASYSVGTYSVVVTDANNCLPSMQTFTITQPSAPLTAVTNTTSNYSCTTPNGTAILTPIGGTGVTTVIWSAGNAPASYTNTGLSVGVISYTLTDANSCRLNGVVEITGIPTPVIATIQKQDVLCNGQNTGSLSFTVNGGTPGYNYSWSNTSDNVNTQDSLAAGSYTVIVTDAGSCFFTHTFSIIEPDSIHMDMVTSASCQNEPTGSAVISVSGGTPGYDIQWSNGQSGNTMTAVNVGAYTAVVIDNAGCAITGNVSILEKACVELFVPQIFTPNGDGKNDKFVVLKIEDFPNNAFSVFNRWGSLVYAKKNYQNEWNGKANVGDSVGDDTLPTGTYYVIIEFNDGHTKPYTGFVQLQL